MVAHRMILESSFILLLHTAVIFAQTYNVGSFCRKFEIYQMREGDIAYVKYTGEDIKKHYTSCSIEFYARSDDYNDEFKMCVTAEVFEPKDNALKLRYAKSVTQNVQDFSKYSPPPYTYCMEHDAWFYISFKDDRSASGTDRGRVTLKIEPIKTYDSSKEVGSVIGAVIGVIVVLVLIISICYCFYKRRRTDAGGSIISRQNQGTYQQPQQISTAQYPRQPQTQYPVQQQQPFGGQYGTTQYQYMGQGPLSSQPQYQPVPQQNEGNNFSQPPPSYDEVVHPKPSAPNPTY